MQRALQLALALYAVPAAKPSRVRSLPRLTPSYVRVYGLCTSRAAQPDTPLASLAVRARVANGGSPAPQSFNMLWYNRLSMRMILLPPPAGQTSSVVLSNTRVSRTSGDPTSTGQLCHQLSSRDSSRQRQGPGTNGSDGRRAMERLSSGAVLRSGRRRERAGAAQASACRSCSPRRAPGTRERVAGLWP